MHEFQITIGVGNSVSKLWKIFLFQLSHVQADNSGMNEFFKLTIIKFYC